MESMQAVQDEKHRRPAKRAGESKAPGALNLQSELSCDMREIIASLALYCELLADPAVLNAQHGHLAQELGLVVQDCRALLRKMAVADTHQTCRYSALCAHFERLLSPRC